MDELDAVKLGLRRGPRGAVCLALLVVAVPIGLLATRTSEEPAAPQPSTPPLEELAPLAPLPKPKRQPVKRSAAKRAMAPKPATAAKPAVPMQPAREPAELSSPALASAEPSSPAREPAEPTSPALASAEPSSPAREPAEPTSPALASAEPSSPAREPSLASAAPPSPAPEPAEQPAPEPMAVIAREELVPPPPPPPEPVELEHDGNGEAIARAIAAEKRAAVRACFESELKQSPKLHGTVVVELDLAPPNRVHAVRVQDDLERTSFTSCVAATMRNVRFGALDEEISVSVPYVLTPAAK